MTAAQRAAVESESSSVLCIAGPGSGKTFCQIRRICHLVRDRGVAPESICCLTFTNSGAREVRKRLEEEGIPGTGYCGTLHSFAMRSLRTHGRLIGYPGSVAIFPDAEKEALIKHRIAAMGLKNRTSASKVMKRLESEMREERIPTPEGLVAKQFLREIRAEGMVILSRMLFDLSSLLEKEEFREACGFSHLFVDEAQDSSSEDWAVYDAFPAQNRFVIGDPRQAIYGFRGGKVEEMLGRMNSEKWDVCFLTDNFRSTRQICECAQRLISHNPEGRVSETSAAGSAEGPDPKLSRFDTGMMEAVWLASQIKQEMDSGTPASEIAVLCRTNDLARKMTEWLRGMGISEIAASGTAESEHPDLGSALLALDILENPENNLLTEIWLRSSSGEDYARKARRAADQQGKSINSSVLKWPGISSLEPALAFIEKEGISRSSCEYILDVAGADCSPSEAAAAVRLEMRNVRKAPGVTVTTIHQSKGREWEAVFMPAFEKRFIPGRGQAEDERRLAFVGMTRAKRRLELSWSCSREVEWAGAKEMELSPFALEAGFHPMNE